MDKLVELQGRSYNVAPVEESDEVRELLRGARAPTTRKVYASCMKAFATWCAARGAEPMPAEPKRVREYLATCAVGTWRQARSTCTFQASPTRIATPDSGSIPPSTRASWMACGG